MPRIEWQWKRFAELAPQELYALLAARAAVFVVEQDVRLSRSRRPRRVRLASAGLG